MRGDEASKRKRFIIEIGFQNSEYELKGGNQNES
jgi:hypothetical protein